MGDFAGGSGNGRLIGAGARTKGRSSFLKKRSKRLLQIQVFVPPERGATALAKVFWFFFSKKNTYFFPRQHGLSIQAIAP
jgi:hypothetical protein